MRYHLVAIMLVLKGVDGGGGIEVNKIEFDEVKVTLIES